MKNSPQNKPISSNEIEILTGFLSNQKESIAIQKEQIELQKTQLNFSHQYAMAALAAQKEDRADERKNNAIKQKNNYIIISIVVLAILIFSGIALYLGKDEFLKEVIKIVIYAVPSLLGGYMYGYNKGKKRMENESLSSYQEE